MHCCRGCHFYCVFTKRSYKKVLFLFTESEIYEIVNKTQLQNISMNDITNAIDINPTTIELADTSEEHSISNTENIVVTEIKL